MKIAYIAKHGQHGNCDEDSIGSVLQSLGHDVVCVEQSAGANVVNTAFDVVLYHKWFDYTSLARLAGKTLRVAWHFDLLRHPGDRKLAMHVAKQAEVSDLVFATDGDWVNNRSFRNKDRCYWLCQGADERIVNAQATEINGPQPIDVLFVGGQSLGPGRKVWIAEMQGRWGTRFKQVERVYRRDIAAYIKQAKIVVAPDSPGSSHYWSNRIYLMLGFGAFLIHPYYTGLTAQYSADKEIVYYPNQRELHDKITHYLSRPDERAAIAKAGLERTKAEHLYRHRVISLLEIINQNLKGRNELWRLGN